MACYAQGKKGLYFVSMNRSRCFLNLASVALVTVGVAGCAQRKPGATTSPSGDGSRGVLMPTTRDANAVAYLALDDIPLRPVLRPATQPTTQSADAPLESIQLFARARAAMLENQPFTAINFLERAIVLDPESFDLNYMLGRAYLGRKSNAERAIAAFERAEKIDPDHLDLQIELGRQYIGAGKIDAGIEHLRLALQTADYTEDDDRAATADYLLADALQQKGYDRAALDRYDILLKRLERPGRNIRSNPELHYLVMRPELLMLQIGQLYEKNGQYADALKAYQPAAERDPGNFELQSKVTRMLLASGQRDAATRRAADVVMRFRASSESLKLIKDVYEQIGRPGAVADELRRLLRTQPDDRALLFSLSDVLVSQGRVDDAASELSSAVLNKPGDVETVKKLFDLYDTRDQTESAAKLLIEVLARAPDLQRELMPMWTRLLEPGRRNRLRVGKIQDLPVASASEASKQFWISTVAQVWNRDALARSAMEKSAGLLPVYPPALRAQMNAVFARQEFDDRQKNDATAKLIETASQAGAVGLSRELAGLLALRRNESTEALRAFDDAIKAGDNSPDLLLVYAAALRQQGNDTKAEQYLWKLVTDRPGFDDAWYSLFRFYADQQNGPAARNVIDKWLAADPGTINGRILLATILFQAKQVDDAEQILTRLFNDYPGRPEVLAINASLYQQTGRINLFIAKLEELRSRQPDNQDVVQRLVGTYVEQGRTADALRVLDATRSAVASDADLLYYVAHLYQLVGQNATTEEVLADVIKLDPRNASANNDLGYTWVDRGEKLDESERMIRIAVDVEPDNQSFLDSLGWALYKRGKFAEAHKYFELAVGPAAFPDPVVLDHLGDVLYRLDRKDEALKVWKRAQERLNQTESNRADIQQLRLVLQQKIPTAERGLPITVAPLAPAVSNANPDAQSGEIRLPVE